MIRKLLCAATLGLSMIGSSVQAVEHTVYINYSGFFPETTYLQAGDTVKFISNHYNSLSVYATKSSNRWESYTLYSDDEWTLNIASGTQTRFRTSRSSRRGYFVFGSAPTN